MVEKEKSEKQKKEDERKKRVAAGEEYIKRRERLRSAGLSKREAAEQLTKEEELSTKDTIAELTAEKRKEAFQAETGTPQLTTELQQQILEPPSMQPISLAKNAQSLIGAREFQPLGITGFSASSQLLQNPEKELKRAGVELAAGTLLGGLSLPYLAQIIASSKMINAVTGVTGSSTLLKTAIAGLGIYTIGGRVFDYKGGEMESYRTRIQKVVEDGERIEAAVRNGMNPEDAIRILREMADETSNAERRIKELGNFNIEYRASKEYLEDMVRVRSAREAILRRILAIENIAATGQAALNIEELLFEAEQMKGGEKNE